MPHISAYQCTSMPHISAHLSNFQCYPSVPVSATYQCQSVPPHQCHLSVSISAAYQCPLVQPH
ncbi:unnamed protein product [Staurois parvus]|uniref:Uncharacterized protein n=1 Tax=Staurois parvus TaxID=386267 RepID=A0ABN9BX57_9NEOB|nr:unnamed protein product [Staurois parvus]